jgi:hypothetical protein
MTNLTLDQLQILIDLYQGHTPRANGKLGNNLFILRDKGFLTVECTLTALGNELVGKVRALIGM